jgi:integrase
MAQQGTVFERSGSWYLQYRRTDFQDGQPIRRRVTEKLVRKSSEYRTRRDVEIKCSDQINGILSPINKRQHLPESSLSLAEFTEKHFLIHIEGKITQGYMKPSTLKFYKDVFNNHLKNTVGGVSLRNFTTLDAQNLFDEIDRTKNLTHKSLQRIKTGLSAIFTYAKQQNIVQLNPVQGTKVEGRRTKPARYAYTLKEVLNMISALPQPASTVVAVAGFTGLRLGEIRGLQWRDYDGENLNICRSVWRTHILAPKTESSEAKVPVIPSLRAILNEHRTQVPNSPESFIFAGERKGSPLNLANLVRRGMTTIVEKGLWHGWHGFRRGLATRLHESEVQLEVIQEILRHSDPKVTQDSYIVVKSDKTKKAMRKVDGGGVLKAWHKQRKNSR